MIPLIKSTFYNEAKTKKQLNKFISGADKLSFGSQCLQFEKNFAKFQSRKDCVLVNSGSSANLAIVQALLNMGKIQVGDYVGFSAVTWSTNVMPLIQLGLNPVPIDVEPDSLNVSSKTLKKTLKKHPLSMLFITNLLGFCDDIDQIEKICQAQNIVLLEDNCESFGTNYKNRLLGNYSLASTFSFYVGHHLSTIEGGAICTDDSELATHLRMVRAHGWDRNLDSRNQQKIRKSHEINSTFYSRYTFYDLGYNLRPTEITGFLGNTQLQYADEIIQKRVDNFKIFSSFYQNSDKYYPLRFDHIQKLSNFAFPVICKTAKIKEEIVKACKGKIEIRPMVAGNMIEQPFYKKYHSNLIPKDKLPGAQLIHKNGLYMGNNPELTTEELVTMLKALT